VLRNPVVESILTFGIELGFVVHVTESVTSNVPLAVVAVAVNWFVEPYGMLVRGEVTVILVMPLSVTVIVALPLKVPEDPVILDVPGPTPITTPLVLPTVATLVVPLLQNTPELSVLVLPSLKVPVAVICTVLPCWMLAVGPTATLVSVGLTKKPVQPTARAIRKRVANAARSWSVRLWLGFWLNSLLGMIEKAPVDASFRQRPQAAQDNCSREDSARVDTCTTVCSRVESANLRQD
jgi:hypothetical protein